MTESELRYRTLIEQLPIVTYIDALDDRSSNIYTSPQLEPILGYSVEEWQADEELFVRILHPDDRERVLAQIQATNASGERFECEYRLIARDGRVVWFRDESVLVRDESGAPLYSQGYLLDITDRKTAETVLEAVAAIAGELVATSAWEGVDVVGRLRTAVRTSRAYLVQDLGGQGGRRRAGKLLAESTDGTVGSMAEAASGGRFDYGADGFGAFRAALEHGQIVRRIAGDFPASEQREWEREGVRSTLVVPIQVGGVYWGHIGFQDCVEERIWTDAEADALRAGASILGAAIHRHATRDALAESEARFAAFMDTTPAIAFAKDVEGRYVYANARWLELFGHTLDELLGHTDAELFPDSAEEFRLHDAAALAAGGSVSNIDRIDVGGTARALMTLKFPFRDRSGEEFLGGVALDITERKRAERRLAAQHAVARALAESATLDEAAPRILEEVCGALGWEIGGLWTVDRALDRLRLASIWYSGHRRFERFVDESWSLELDRGEGFPGAVWETGETRWFADVAGSSRSRSAAVASAGLHGALVAPIVSAGDVLGVLELFSTRVWEPDDDLVAMLTSIGSQVGQFLHRTQADREVREREERFRTLVANLPGAVYRCAADEDWTMSFLSDVIREITGYPASDFIDNAARSFASVIHPDDRATVSRLVGAALRRKEPFELEYRIAHADGSVRWVAEKGQPIIGPGGSVLWLDGAIFDVTEQNAVEAALATERDRIARTNHLLDSIVESLPTPLFLKDADELRFARVNRAAEELWGLPRETLIGRSDRDFFPPEQAEFFIGKDRRVLDDQQLLDIPEEPLETRTLGTRYLHTRKVPIVDETGRSRYLLGISLDITDQKLAAAELERLLAQLAEQNEQLRALDRLKDEFVALVSHELRTPLTSILGYLELVLEGEAGEITDDQARFLAIIDRNARRLLRLVGDLLFVAQIEAGKLALEREPCNLAQLAADCLEAARLQAFEQEIELTLESEARVELLGDRTRLAQLLDNLVSNAIKFTPEGGLVCVRLTRHERRVVVGVSDTGMGIPPDEQVSLFQRFFRSSEATRRAIPGTGLGLTITKAIVDAHGGSIDVESKLGGGTTFVVELPVEPAGT